jgi:hypothetical protein
MFKTIMFSCTESHPPFPKGRREGNGGECLDSGVMVSMTGCLYHEFFFLTAAPARDALLHYHSDE